MKIGKIKNWYKSFFDKYYLPLYLKKGIFSPSLAQREVDFAIKVFNLPKNSKILDLPCGQGRHSILLAQKGYQITGVDLSKTLLDLAKKLAQKEKVKIHWIRQNMRKIDFKNEFNAVINLFSSFGYFTQEKENIMVLKLINQSLKTKGKFLLDLLNKDWFLAKLPASKKIWWKTGANYILEDAFFDKQNKFWLNRIVIISPEGKIKRAQTYMRLYDLQEIKKCLEKTGFKILNIYGDYQGNKFFRFSPRMIVLAEKTVLRDYE